MTVLEEKRNQHLVSVLYGKNDLEGNKVKYHFPYRILMFLVQCVMCDHPQEDKQGIKRYASYEMFIKPSIEQFLSFPPVR